MKACSCMYNWNTFDWDYCEACFVDEMKKQKRMGEFHHCDQCKKLLPYCVCLEIDDDEEDIDN